MCIRDSNKAGVVSYTDYSTLDVSSLVDIKYGDMFYYATLEIEGNTVSGCWFYDHSKGEEGINATLSYIPCAGRYICSNYENVSDDKALVTSYFFVTKENFEDNPLYKDKASDLPTGDVYKRQPLRPYRIQITFCSLGESNFRTL